MKDSNRIILIRTPHGWLADYVGPHSQRIQQLFGCTLIPTAFTERALPAVVKREIEYLNPEVSVELAAGHV